MKAPQLQPMTQAQHWAEIERRLSEAIGSLAEAMFHAGMIEGADAGVIDDAVTRCFNLVGSTRDLVATDEPKWTPFGLTR